MTEKNTPEKIADELLQSKIDKKIAENKSTVKKVAQINPKVKSPPIKPKYYYDVKVECMLPAVLTYRVLAEDPEEAATLIRGLSPTGVKHRIVGKKDIKLSVYEAGSSMLRWTKNLLGY